MADLDSNVQNGKFGIAIPADIQLKLDGIKEAQKSIDLLEDAIQDLRDINEDKYTSEIEKLKEIIRLKKEELGINDDIAESSNYDDNDNEETKPSSWKQFGGSVKSFAVDKFKSISNLALEKLKGIFDGALEEQKNLLNYSRTSNSQTRNTMLTYGFSNAQAYGYDTAMSMLGFSSMEDLYYANDTEKRLFQETLTKYTNKYNELYDSGYYNKMLEYNVEMEEFKQDLELEVIDFFMENKETIKGAMNALIVIMQNVVKMANLFGTRANTWTNFVNNNVELNYNNSFTGGTEANKQQLVDVGNMTYSQIINYLNQG